MVQSETVEFLSTTTQNLKTKNDKNQHGFGALQWRPCLVMKTLSYWAKLRNAQRACERLPGWCALPNGDSERCGGFLLRILTEDS